MDLNIFQLPFEDKELESDWFKLKWILIFKFQISYHESQHQYNYVNHTPNPN